MVALNPQFALLATQCMISLIALPLPATAIAVRSHSNHPGYFPQRERNQTIPAPRGSSTKEHDSSPMVKKLRAREYLYNESCDSDLGVCTLVARDSLAQEDLAGLLGPVIDALGKVSDTLKSLLSEFGLTRRHDAIEYNDGPSRRHHHHSHHGNSYDVNEETIYNNGPSRNHIHQRSFSDHTHRPSKRYTDLRGTAALMDNNVMTGFLKLAGLGFGASKDGATTILLRPTEEPGSDGKQLVQMVVPGSNSQGDSYCATYDPNPNEPSEMTAKPCSSLATAHQSQLFSYDVASGSLEPMHSAPATEGNDLPAADRLDADSDDLAENENVRMLARASGTSLKFIPETGMKDTSSSTSVSTVTVTETATQTDSSSAAAAVVTPPTPVDATDLGLEPTPADATSALGSMPTPVDTPNALGSMPSPVDATNTLGSMPTPVDAPKGSVPTPPASPTSPSLPIVEVALPSSTSTSASPESSDVSSTVSTDPASVAASIASSSMDDGMTTSGTSSYPTPASLLVQITQPATPGSSA